MKKLFIASFICLSIVGGSSCTKVLNTKPQDFLSPDLYFTKPEDAEAALGAAWRQLTLSYMYQGLYQYRWQVGDDIWSANSPGVAPGNIGVPTNDPQFASRWNQMYQTVQYLNILLENLPRIPMDAADKNIYRGEALFLRSFVYYELIKDFGDVPMRLVPSKNADDVNLAATPRKDVYAQILKDLTEAEAYLPTTARTEYGGAGYAARTTAQALLARICLSMAGPPINDVAKYQDARDWAEKVIKSGEHALNPDFAQIFKNYATGTFDKKETLWEVDFNVIAGNNGAGGQIGYLDGVLQTNIAVGYAQGQVNVTRKLLLSYGPFATNKDLRRDITCANFTWKGNLYAGDVDAAKNFLTTTTLYLRDFNKFKVYQSPLNLSQSITGLNWPMIRYSDVLLMYAEADNEINGPTTTSYGYINHIRQRGWGKLLPGATNPTEANAPAGMSQADFREFIRNERYRELAGEGTRRQDLIRWGIFVGTLKNITADVLDNTVPAETERTGTAAPYTFALNYQNITDKHLLYPKPVSELQYNRLLKQNPGWE